MLMLGRKPVSPLCMPYAGFEKATNCVLEIPQNLKLTLENNVLTLKSGSIITLMGSTYAIVTTSSDVSRTYSGLDSNQLFYVFCSASGTSLTSLYKIENVWSGTTAPEVSISGRVFYNSNDKYAYSSSASGWNTTPWNVAYPLAILQTDGNGNLSFAKDSNGNSMIFNGAGFIGHHAFVYPNVKALIPDGFNSDGSYKTIEATTNSLSIHEIVLGTGAYGDGSRYFAISTTGNITGWGGYTIREKDEDFTNDNWLRQYVKESNKTYTWTGSEKQQMYETPFINYKCDTNGLVTKFDVSQPLTRYRWVVKLIP